MVLSALWMMTRCLTYESNNDGEHVSNRQRHIPSNTGEHTISGLPRPKVISCVLDESMAECTGSLCTICLDDLSLGANVGMLACGHAFHYECVHAWLKHHWWEPRCPMRCSHASRRSPNTSSFERAAVVTSSSSDGDIQI